MFTRTFALFLRALRVDARLLHSHLMRLFLLAFVGVMLMVTQLVFSPVMGAPGLWFFQFITWINYGFATLAAGFLFAAAITEEKEERTLGLLRMADVGPLPLLVGKAAPRLVAALLILCVQFPFTLLAITLGGISWDQVTAVFCTLLAHVVLVGGLALLFSVVVRRTGTAIALTFLVVLPLSLFPPMLTFAFSTAAGVPPAWVQSVLPVVLPVLHTIVAASAAPRLYGILLTGFNDGAMGFQVLSNLAAGGGLFLLSWLLFDPCNRNLDDEVRSSGPVAGILNRRKRRSLRSWRLAIVGKDFRAQAGGWPLQCLRMLIYASFFLLFAVAVDYLFGSSVDLRDVGDSIVMWTLFFILPVEIMILCCRLYRTEIRDRTWPMLLNLPLSLPEVAYAKLAGALFALIPCAIWFCLGVSLNPEDFAQTLNDIIEEPMAILGIIMYGAHLLLFAHLTTLFSVLSNAWAGALLAIVTSFMGFILNYFIIILPLMVMTLTTGGPGWGPDETELYFGVAMAFSSAVIVLIAACVHYLIGVQLKLAAAQ